MSLSVRRLATLGWVAIGIAYLVALAMPPVWLPSDGLGMRRFRTPEIDRAIQVAQTFTMPADGLYAVEFSPALTAARATGDIRLELWDVTDGPDRRIRSAEVSGAAMVREPSYRFTFPPVLDSKDRRYRLDLISSETRPADGIAVWATAGARYGGGTMLINGVLRWADLAFETHAPVHARWRMLWSMGAGSGLSRGHVVMAAFAASWVLIGVILRMLCDVSDKTSSFVRST